jgi:hypothetical protein
MSVHLEFFHPDRIVVGIGRGNITREEYQKFLMEVVQAGALHYRKIIDITSISSSPMGTTDMLAFEEALAERAKALNFVRGPLAIVVARDRVENALAFKAMSSKDRPVEVFHTIRDARKWLLDQPVTQPGPKS